MSDQYDAGATVWFDRGFGPEKGTVFTHDGRQVAISVGPLSLGDRLIRDQATVYDAREQVLGDGDDGLFEEDDI